jgi:hypothetical protein
MRTRTTTREGTQNRALNYPLKMFVWHLSNISPVFKEVYEKIREVELLRVIERGEELTRNPDAIYVINSFLAS